jgi:hypothetical protein
MWTHLSVPLTPPPQRLVYIAIAIKTLEEISPSTFVFAFLQEEPLNKRVY